MVLVNFLLGVQYHEDIFRGFSDEIDIVFYQTNATTPTTNTTNKITMDSPTFILANLCWFLDHSGTFYKDTYEHPSKPDSNFIATARVMLVL